MACRVRWGPKVWALVWTSAFMCALLVQAGAQQEQRVKVTIKNFAFVIEQKPLHPSIPILIVIRNEDSVRHDFGSVVFQGIPTQVESGGIISYGREIGGVYIDPQRSAAIRFTLERPGQYRFRCSIHPDMKGELVFMSVGVA